MWNELEFNSLHKISGKLIKVEIYTILLVNIANYKNDSWLVNCN